jgi:hypothetical protein
MLSLLGIGGKAMTVALLFNIPSTDEEMAAWSFAHQAHHRDINAAILQERKIALPEYILDPVNLSDPVAFLDLHQQMHNNTDGVLGIPGYDLTDVDWSDEGQRAGWIFLNAQLHVAEANATGSFS